MIRVSVANENHVYRRHHIDFLGGAQKINNVKEEGEESIYIYRELARLRAPLAYYHTRFT